MPKGTQSRIYLDFKKVERIMSYNISTFKVKAISDLRIPMAEFFKHERNDFHPELVEKEGHVTLLCGEGEIRGTVNADRVLSVSSIDISGEFSGTFFREVFKPSLEHSEGELAATLVWEGGDSIELLSVIDGTVDLEEYDL